MISVFGQCQYSNKSQAKAKDTYLLLEDAVHNISRFFKPVDRRF